MNGKSFITTLFMSIAGLAFIAIAFAPIVLNVVKWIENTNIKNNGEQINATITYRSIIDNEYNRHDEGFSDMSRTYFIEYEVNGKKYMESIDSTEKNHKVGETITIYCLLDNPEKIYAPLENKGRILSIFIVFPIFSMLGYACIRNYNIFTYKKS